MNLSDKDRGVLFMSARESIRSGLGDVPAPTLDYRYYPELLRPCGAFVTLTKDGNLRGCIGYITSDEPLFQTVCEAALLAATEDPRFIPVQENELSDIVIEISVLSTPEKLDDYNNIIIGTHGLLLEEADGRGVLLPQVATEHNMNRTEFLSAVCTKSGLPSNAWMKRKLNLYTFTADVFSEQQHKDLTREGL